MRASLLTLLAVLALAACYRAPTVVYLPPPPVVYSEPDTVGAAARFAAEVAAVARDARETRRREIVLRSRGEASITVARDTRLLDASALTGETLARVDSGEVLEAHSFDGRYWGVQRDAEWGYVPESAVVRNDDAREMVTQGPYARPAAPSARRTATGRGTSGGASGGSVRARCADFSSRAEAQAVYDANPSAYSELDTDNDGRACENGTGSSAGRSSGRSARRSSGRRSSGAGRTYIRGPRGGCYYINSNGNRTYVDRSLCG